jgi:hypothetical protein
MKNKIESVSLVTGLTLLTLTIAAFIVPSLLFLAGLPIWQGDFWLAAALSIVITWIASKKLVEKGQATVFAVSVGLSALLFIGGFAACGAFYDLSYDGQAYHQETIIHLVDGWNPVYDKELALPTGQSIWINHYAKAAEIAAAAIYKATGLLEPSKVINLLPLVASGLLSLAALLRLKPTMRVAAGVIALLLALNPIVICQLFSFYVDGLLGSLLLCLMALGCLFFTRPSWLLLSVYTLTMIMTMNIKFTAIAYAGVLTLGLLVALYMSEQFAELKRLFRLAAVGGIIGVVVVGYHPYITNTLHDGHPFYPLAGTGAIDVVKNFTPRNLERMNRFEQVATSYFAEPAGNDTAKKPTRFQWPFTLTAKELPVFAETDVAVAGFGPLFSGALVLALIVLLLAFRNRQGTTLAAIGIIVVLAVSSFINPAAWWARYVPQLWIVPLICAWLAFSLKGYRLVNGAGIVLAVVIAANSMLIGSIYLSKQWAWSGELRSQLAGLQNAPQPLLADFTYSWSNRERLKAYGIEFTEQTPLACSSEQVTLIKSGTTVCINPNNMQAKAQ